MQSVLNLGRRVLPAVLLCLVFVPLVAEPKASAAEPQTSTAIVADNPLELSEGEQRFRKSLVKAIQNARTSGKIGGLEAVRLRVACWSPAFVERAQQLAVVQIAFSGETAEEVPYTEDGRIDVANIDWEGLIKFLEVLIPLLLQLLAGI